MTKAIVLIAIRAAALAAGLAGQTRASNALYASADAIEAGTATDADMERVANLLKSRKPTDEDWADVEARLAEHQARLHAP